MPAEEIRELLGGARAALAGGTGLPPARVTRSAALFARCAVEAFVDAELDRALAPLALGHGDAGSSMRVRLLCLAVEGDRDVAARIEWVWDALSVICHHHAYELTPTHAEVAHLVDEVAALVSGSRGSAGA